MKHKSIHIAHLNWFKINTNIILIRGITKIILYRPIVKVNHNAHIINRISIALNVGWMIQIKIRNNFNIK